MSNQDRNINISRRRFLKNVGTGAIATAVAPTVLLSAEQTGENKMENQPNVIFVLTDDQGPWAAGCCGNDEVPHTFH